MQFVPETQPRKPLRRSFQLLSPFFVSASLFRSRSYFRRWAKTYELRRGDCEVADFPPSHEKRIANPWGFPAVDLQAVMRPREDTVALGMERNTSEKKDECYWKHSWNTGGRYWEFLFGLIKCMSMATSAFVINMTQSWDR